MLLLARRYSSFLLLMPAVMLLAAFFVVPTLQLVGLSFEGPSGPFTHYSRIFERPVYVQVLQRTFLTSALTAMLCVLIGYPVAYRLVTGSNRTRLILLAMILVPFWTNLLVLCYGWLIVLNPQGAVNTLLLDIGVIASPLPMSGSLFAVLVGMVQTMLPYLILPVAANMARIDTRVLQAARSLGAPPLQVFLRAYLPMTMPGVMAGALLVFIMSVGFFIIPAILGGTRDIFIAQLIEMNINRVLNWGFAAALSTIVLVTTLALYAIGVRWFRLGSIWGAGMTPGARLQFGITVVVALAMIMMILPNVIILPASFGGEDYIIFPPRSLSTKWYSTFFETLAWQSSTANSFIVAILCTIAATILGTLAALGMARLTQRTRGLVMSFFLLPTIVPTIITGVALYGLLSTTGLRGGIAGIVIGHTIIATPFVVINVIAALQRMDVRLEHGARSLGASPLRAFYHVTLPIIWPGIAAGAAFAFLTSFSELVLALFLTSGATTTLPVQMWSGIRFEINPTVAAASSLFVVVSCVMLLAVGMLRRRQGRSA